MGLELASAVEPPVRILPLGDSLTYGETLIPEVQGGFRNRLYTVLTAAGFNVDFVGTQADTDNPALMDVNHEGHPGDRIDQIQANIDVWLKSVEDPDVVLLLIGTNDVWQNLNLAAAPTRLGNLIADIATKRPFAKIIVSNLPPRIDSNPFEAKQITFNNAIPGIIAQQVALGRQVTLLDMHSVLNTGVGDYSSDGVHPSTGGYVKMADAWAPKITEVITPKGTANPPLIVQAGPRADLTHLEVKFSKPVADDAVSLVNFSLSGGLTVSNAVLDAATKRTVTLTTSAQTPGLVYSVSVSGIRDRTPEQHLIAPQSMATFSLDAITNGSFENGPNGWTVTGNQEVKSGLPYTATDGANLVAFNAGDSPPDGVLSQTFATTVGQIYQLKFDYGVYAYNTTSPQQLQVAVQGGTSPLVSHLLTINRNGGGGGVVWATATYDFTAVTTMTTLIFTDTSTTSASLDLLLDHVRVVAQATHYLAVASSTSGAAMVISPVDTSGNGSGTAGLIRNCQEGSSVTVTAAPTHEGGNFLMWQKNGVDLAGSSPAISVTMNANQSLTAIYAPNGPPASFAQWLAENHLAAGPGDDSDGDSLSNAVEYVVGGNPVNSPDTQLNPTMERVSADLDGNEGAENYLLFSYRRTERAHLDPSTAIHVEWSRDLAGPWSDAGQTTGVIIIDEVPAEVGVKWVNVYLPGSLAAEGRVFARLKVVIQSAL